jgi:hypothetical protein
MVSLKSSTPTTTSTKSCPQVTITSKTRSETVWASSTSVLSLIGRRERRGRRKGEGRREKKEKGEGRREKGEGRREKGEGRRNREGEEGSPTHSYFQEELQ